MTENGIYDQIHLRFFRSFQNNFGLWPINHPKNTLKHSQGNVFDFPNIRISSVLHGCCSVGSNCLILHPIKTMFSMNWFNLAKMAWAVEQTPTLRQHNLTMVFVSWLANLQHKINWTSSDISVVSSSYIPNNWAFFSFSRSCFNKSSEMWGHLHLVVLVTSGIFLTLETNFFPPWKRLFFLHRQWVFGDASNNAFDLFWWVECCDLTHLWDVLKPNYFYQIRLHRIGNALKDAGSAFLLLCDKTHARCRHRSSICAS